MLRSLRLENFRSFADATIPFEPLTVLVGLNGAGKSNVLDGLKVLQGLALEHDLPAALDGEHAGGYQTWQGIRGGSAEAIRHGHTSFVLESRWSVAEAKLRHTAEIFVFKGESAFVTRPQFKHEKLEDEQSGSILWRTELVNHPDDEDTTVYRALFAGTQTLSHLNSSSSLLNDQPGDSLTSQLAETIANLQVLNVTPERMRDWVPRNAKEIGLAGENLSAIIARRKHDAARLEGLQDWIAELIGDEGRGLDVLEAPTGDVMLQLTDASGGRVTARSMSDGTLRFLGQIVAIEELKPGRTLFMEEPDAALHPARIHLLAQKLEAETAPGRDKQVIITTHSPQFLNWLSRDRWNGVVLLWRDPETHATRATRVTDLPALAQMPPSTRLGDLLATEWLERAT